MNCIKQLSDQDLIDKSNEGNSEAMEELYFRYRNWVMKLAYSICNNDADSQDILQETFKSFFSKFPGLKLTCQVKTYLYPIVRSKTIDLIRKKQKLVFVEDPQTEDIHHSATDPDSIREAISEMVCNLSIEHRDVIILRFVDGYNLNEIAERLNIPTGTVKSRLHKALQNLRKEYNATIPDSGDAVVRLLLLFSNFF